MLRRFWSFPLCISFLNFLHPILLIFGGGGVRLVVCGFGGCGWMLQEVVGLLETYH